jgi:hypothetical protein
MNNNALFGTENRNLTFIMKLQHRHIAEDAPTRPSTDGDLHPLE